MNKEIMSEKGNQIGKTMSCRQEHLLSKRKGLSNNNFKRMVIRGYNIEMRKVITS